MVETGSFTRAARRFSVSASSLSRRVADLETSLGATLLKRSTRTVRLTEIGRSYYEEVREILVQLQQSDESVRSYHARPMGQLRISSTVGFGEHILLPLLQEFSQLYPDVVLDVSLTDELSALGRDDVDIAIRAGYAPDEHVLAIKLMSNNFIAAAAPGYLARMGTPGHPRELVDHKGLYFRTPAGPIPWICEINGQWQEVAAPPAAVSNSGKWLAERAVQGEGILMAPRWSLAPYLGRGELRELAFDPALQVTQNIDLAIHLLYQKQRYLVPKVKVAVDFIVARAQGS